MNSKNKNGGSILNNSIFRTLISSIGGFLSSLNSPVNKLTVHLQYSCNKFAVLLVKNSNLNLQICWSWKLCYYYAGVM